MKQSEVIYPEGAVKSIREANALSNAGHTLYMVTPYTAIEKIGTGPFYTVRFSAKLNNIRPTNWVAYKGTLCFPFTYPHVDANVDCFIFSNYWFAYASQLKYSVD